MWSPDDSVRFGNNASLNNLFFIKLYKAEMKIYKRELKIVRVVKEGIKLRVKRVLLLIKHHQESERAICGGGKIYKLPVDNDDGKLWRSTLSASLSKCLYCDTQVMCGISNEPKKNLLFFQCEWPWNVIRKCERVKKV